MNPKLALILGLSLALSAPLAVAEDEPPQRSAIPETGDNTRAWLELQKSNNAAWGTPRPMSGDVAAKVYERYLNSFGHPIPEQYEREGFVQGGSSQ